MNLLYEQIVRKQYIDKIAENKTVKFHNYREFEYEEKLPYLIDSLLRYMVNNTTDEFKFEYEYYIEDISSGINFNRTDALMLVIKYHYKYKSNEDEDVLRIKIPKLVDRYFFYLRDNKYIPVIRLKDRFIRYGPEKILIDALFATLSIEHSKFVSGRNLKEKIRTFNPEDKQLVTRIATEKTLPTQWLFYELFKDEPEFLVELSKFYNFDFTQEPTIGGRQYRSFVDHLDIFDKSGKRDLNEILTNALFTDYIVDAYEIELGFRPNSIKDIIKFLFTKLIMKDDYSFAALKNLQNRRFVFLEEIMWAFTRLCFDFLIKLSMSGRNVKFTTNKERLITLFIAGDKRAEKKPGKYLYDYGSVYTGVMANIAIQMDGDVKRFMRSLHQSYRNIICPISTSSSEPGVQIHINPEVELTRYGHIVPVFKPLNSSSNE